MLLETPAWGGRLMDVWAIPSVRSPLLTLLMGLVATVTQTRGRRAPTPSAVCQLFLQTFLGVWAEWWVLLCPTLSVGHRPACQGAGSTHTSPGEQQRWPRRLCLRVAPRFRLSLWTREGLAAVVTESATHAAGLRTSQVCSVAPAEPHRTTGPGQQSHGHDSGYPVQPWGPAAFRQLWGIFTFPAKMGS